VVSGLVGKIKTLYNIKDVNYKFISFPIKYNLIPHPLHLKESCNVGPFKESLVEIIKPSVTVEVKDS
jgi:hypothetical protein